MANMKFFIAGEETCYLNLPLSDELGENEYFNIADENKEENLEYVSIVVEFPAPREPLIILSA